MPLQIEGLPADFDEADANIDMQTSESCISMGLGSLPPGSYSKTKRQDINAGNYYADADSYIGIHGLGPIHPCASEQGER